MRVEISARAPAEHTRLGELFTPLLRARPPTVAAMLTRPRHGALLDPHSSRLQQHRLLSGPSSRGTGQTLHSSAPKVRPRGIPRRLAAGRRSRRALESNLPETGAAEGDEFRLGSPARGVSTWVPCALLAGAVSGRLGRGSTCAAHHPQALVGARSTLRLLLIAGRWYLGHNAASRACSRTRHRPQTATPRPADSPGDGEPRPVRGALRPPSAPGRRGGAHALRRSGPDTPRRAARGALDPARRHTVAIRASWPSDGGASSRAPGEHARALPRSERPSRRARLRRSRGRTDVRLLLSRRAGIFTWCGRGAQRRRTARRLRGDRPDEGAAGFPADGRTGRPGGAAGPVASTALARRCGASLVGCAGGHRIAPEKKNRDTGGRAAAALWRRCAAATPRQAALFVRAMGASLPVAAAQRNLASSCG